MLGFAPLTPTGWPDMRPLECNLVSNLKCKGRLFGARSVATVLLAVAEVHLFILVRSTLSYHSIADFHYLPEFSAGSLGTRTAMGSFMPWVSAKLLRRSRSVRLTLYPLGASRRPFRRTTSP
jgi:hypothetical protein